jgi:hypothetical protein
VLRDIKQHKVAAVQMRALFDKVRRSEHKTEEDAAPASSAANAASEAARVLGHYELLHTLGKGASGKVSSNCSSCCCYIEIY